MDPALRWMVDAYPDPGATTHASENKDLGTLHSRPAHAQSHRRKARQGPAQAGGPPDL